jgi:nucleoside-diphosphate-sugar epimerase
MGKAAGETLIVGWHKTHYGNCARVRIFNTFGPRQTATGNVVPTMIMSAMKIGTIFIHGDGYQTRTLLYVEDQVDALMRAMDLQIFDPVNVGGDHMESIRKIALMVENSVESMTGIKVSIEHDEAVVHDIHRRQPDIRRAEQYLEWLPTTEVDEGIRRTVEYWKAMLDK